VQARLEERRACILPDFRAVTVENRRILEASLSPSGTEPARRYRRLPLETIILALTVVLWIALAIATPMFLTPDNVFNIMRSRSPRS
jgi:hypothetical protein